MGDTLASFRDLKGIGPATEARLHEKGIYTWEALAAAASALAAVRGYGDTLRDVANVVAARRAERERLAAARPQGDGERLESFVLRISLAADGEPQRCQVTHVRTMAEQAWAGWTPAELATFIQQHAGIRLRPASHEKPPRDNEQASPPQPETVSRTAPSEDHLVVLDAGKAIGGGSRDINLVITNTLAARGDFDYRATLAARRLGTGDNGEGWTTVATRTGAGSPPREVALSFPAVQLPPGIHRLRLCVEVRLAVPTSEPPALALA
jgi:hypothetical protein